MNDSIKILHAADFHLDARPPSFLSPEQAACRREERLEVFAEVMRMAPERDAELVLIAGDLFEDAHVRRQTVRRAAETFERLAPARVLIAPGNHDPITPAGFYRAYTWPKNVHVFPPGWSQWRSPDGRCVVSGFGWDRAEITEPMLAQCPAAPEGCVHLVLIHGDVLPAGGASAYLPIRTADLQACPAHYIALGHVHRAEPQQAGPVAQNWMNPGAPEPLDFGEAERIRGVVCGSVGTELRELELVPRKARREYVLRTIEVDGLDGEPAVAERVRNRLPQDQRERDFVRLTLTGRLPPGVKLSMTELRGLLAEEFFFLELEDATWAAYDLDAIAREQGLRGELLRAMRERIQQAASEADRQDLPRALELGLDALEGRDPNAGVQEEQEY